MIIIAASNLAQSEAEAFQKKFGGVRITADKAKNNELLESEDEEEEKYICVLPPPPFPGKQKNDRVNIGRGVYDFVEMSDGEGTILCCQLGSDGEWKIRESEGYDRIPNGSWTNAYGYLCEFIDFDIDLLIKESKRLSPGGMSSPSIVAAIGQWHLTKPKVPGL